MIERFIVQEELEENSIEELLPHMKEQIIDFQNQEAVMGYLNFLSELLRLNANPKEVFTLLCTEIEETCIYHFADSADSVTAVKKYLQLLLELQDAGLSGNSILGILNLHDIKDCNLGIALAKRRDNSIFFYINFLLTLARNNLSFEMMSAFLASQDKNGRTLGMTIAEYQSKDKIRLYLNFLSTLYRIGMQCEQILEIIMVQDKAGRHFGMEIAFFHDGEMMKAYIDFLKCLMEENEIDDLLAKLMEFKGRTRQDEEALKTFPEMVANKQKIQTLYELLDSGLLPPSAYSLLMPKRPQIVDYILSIENNFLKMNAIRDALDVSHPLGKLFYSDPWFYRFFYHDPKVLFREELKKLENLEECVEFYDPFPRM